MKVKVFINGKEVSVKGGIDWHVPPSNKNCLLFHNWRYFDEWGDWMPSVWGYSHYYCAKCRKVRLSKPFTFWIKEFWAEWVWFIYYLIPIAVILIITLYNMFS